MPNYCGQAISQHVTKSAFARHACECNGPAASGLPGLELRSTSLRIVDCKGITLQPSQPATRRHWVRGCSQAELKKRSATVSYLVSQLQSAQAVR